MRGYLTAAAGVLVLGLSGCEAVGDFAAEQMERTGDIYRKVFSGEDKEEETRKEKDEEDEEDENDRRERDGEDEDRDEGQGGDEDGEDLGESEDQAGIINNGGSVVRRNGDDYYWRYTAGSVEPDGLFASFSFKSGAVNQMICRHPDGSQEVLFEAGGYGDIYFAGDRMYLMEEWGGVYSVNLDGSGRIDYSDFSVWDADGETGIVLGVSESTPKVIRQADGSMEIAGAENSIYAGTIDGYAYLSVPDSEGGLVLYRYKMDGSQAAQEVDRFVVPADQEGFGGQVYVTQVSSLENRLYYSYGSYAGTGGFFQGGGINYVELSPDGQPAGRGTAVSHILAEEFLAEKVNGEDILYYIGEENEINGSYIKFRDEPYSACMAVNVNTMAEAVSDFRLGRPGDIVYLNGAMCRARENQAGYDTLLPKEVADSFGCTGDGLESASQLVLLRDVEAVGDDVYFTVEKCSRDTSRDVGWRQGYARTGSERYRLSGRGNQVELLFSY